MSRTPDVVIVDHDIEALKKLVEPLRNEFEFYLTISGNDALTMVARNPIGLLIAGQTLFSGSGIEVLIQARSRAPRTTRVLLANAVERKAVEGVLERAEVFQVLKRPCTAEQLREVLQAASWSARMRPEAGGSVEHIVMETGEHRSLTASASGAPVTVLTNDSGLFEAIRSAVHEHHDVHLATRESEAIELAAAGQCAVLVTDQALTQAALERATHALRAREPALVTVAAGSREQGNALMGLLGNGQIHRFLLKPVAPGLARLAIDSAARQHSSIKSHPRPESGHKPAGRHEPPHRGTSHAHAAREAPTEESTFELGTSLASAPGGVIEAGEPLVPHWRERSWRPWLFTAVGVLLLAAVAVGAWWWFSDRTPTVDQRQVAIDRALFSAEQAYRAGRYVEPETSSALHFYQEALKVDPTQSDATAGLDRIADHYIQQAEALMVEGELEAAAAALATLGWWVWAAGRIVTYEVRTALPVSGLIAGAPVEFHGVEVGRVRIVVFGAGCLLVGTAVASSGSVGYVGLIVPHLVRLSVGSDNRLVVPLSGIAGAIFVIAADTLARTVIAPREFPVGAITALIGAPLFIYLLRRA